MRMFRVVLAAAMATAMLVALAEGVGAKASGAVCSKIILKEADLGALGGKKFNASTFNKAAKAFKAGAKVAPGKVKAAMTTMASYYQRLGNAGSANEALTSITASDTTKYAKASVVWGTFVAKNCA
jgi:hypothetical protein